MDQLECKKLCQGGLLHNMDYNISETRLSQNIMEIALHSREYASRTIG